MKKYIFIVVAVSLVACKKNLDQPPQDQISNSQYWKTAQDLETYTVAVLYMCFHISETRDSIVPNFFIGNIGSDAVYGSDHQVMAAPAPQLNGSRDSNHIWW